MDSLYDILQVSPRVQQDVLQAAYRVLIRKNHPDVGGATAKAQAINQAYEVLSDSVRRQQYDQKNQDIFVSSRAASGANFSFSSKVLQIQCASCLHSFWVRLGAFNEEFFKKSCCPKCGEKVFRDKPSSAKSRPESAQQAAAGSRESALGLGRLVRSMCDKGWVETKSDGYFNKVLQTPFFLKNYLFIKVFEDLDEKTVEAFAEECRRRYENRRFRFLPTGYYFVAISDRIPGEKLALEKSRELGRAGGFSSCCLIPVSLENRRVYFHHVNRGSLPQDIAGLDAAIF